MQCYGYVFLVVSISLAIAVDLVRHYKFNECLTSNEHIIDQCIIRQEYNGCTFVASHFSVLWQLPQQLAASISQVFVVVTAYQIAYLQAPDYESEPCMFVAVISSISGLLNVFWKLQIKIWKASKLIENNTNHIRAETWKLILLFKVYGVMIAIKMEETFEKKFQIILKVKIVCLIWAWNNLWDGLIRRLSFDCTKSIGGWVYQVSQTGNFQTPLILQKFIKELFFINRFRNSKIQKVKKFRWRKLSEELKLQQAKKIYSFFKVWKSVFVSALITNRKSKISLLLRLSKKATEKSDSVGFFF